MRQMGNEIAMWPPNGKC